MAASGELRTDVVVVGAGLAGLTAARRLDQAGVDNLVVEARPRVGGRTLNHHLDGDPETDTTVLDLGAGWVGPGQDGVLSLIRELGLETFPTYSEGDNLSEYRQRMRRYRGTIPRLGPMMLADIAQAQTRLDRMARTVPLDAPWTARRAPVWDRQTVAAWAARNLHTRGGRALLQLMVEAVWAAHPADLSLLHLLFYLHANNGFDALTDVRGGAQQDRVHGGTQAIALAAARELRRQPLLDAPVRSVDLTGGDRVVLTLAGRRTVTARRAVLALAPNLLARIGFEPELPALRHQLHQRMPQGTVIKCYAVYPEPFWREAGLSGQVTSPAGPVKVTFDSGPPGGGGPGVLLAFVEGRQARRLGTRPAAERRRVVLGCLTRFFGPEAGRPAHYLDHSWAAEPYSGGCYAGYFQSNGWSDYGSALRAPIGPLHFAGTETATHGFGYMDGAVRSGERAAAAAIAALGRGEEKNRPAG